MGILKLTSANQWVNSKLSFLYSHAHFAFLLSFILHLLFFWPGNLSPDSMTQYAIAHSGIYSDHHPALMSFVWRYLDKIYEGPGLMLLLHLSLLHSGLYIFFRGLRSLLPFQKYPSLILLLLFMPWYPQILIYSGMIWKDVGFAFSFFFVASVLTYYTLHQKRLPWSIAAGLMIALIYGVSIKFQAQYCAIPLIIWMGSCLTLGYKDWVKIGTALGVAISLYGTVNLINQTLVPQAQKNHSWQFVKLYDLAAISVGANQDIIPAINKAPHYTFEELKKLFNHQAVDPLVFPSDSILVMSKNEDDRNALWRHWGQEILKHPFLYLHHRFSNLAFVVGGKCGFQHIKAIMHKFIEPTSWAYPFITKTVTALSYIFMAHLLTVVIGIAYCILAIRCWKTSVAAPALLGVVSTGLSIVGVLLVLSMAGTPRYSYIAVVMIHGSHLLAYATYREISKNRSITSSS